MDIARAPHNAQTRLKTVMTPIWTREMGHRLRVAREKQLRTQGEMAGLLSTPGHPVSQQQVAAVEGGRKTFLGVTWARLEAALGKHLGYVLIARDAALYNEQDIRIRYQDCRQRELRKYQGRDPKKGECPPNPHRVALDERIKRGRALPRKRGSVR